MKHWQEAFGIELISVLGLEPTEFVALARKLGCPNIGMAPAPVTGPLPGEPTWSFRGNASLVRDMKQALADHAVTISLGEGFIILPGRDISDAEADFDLMADLGASRLNACAMDTDAVRNIDQFAALAEMADARGIPVTVEFMPGTPVDSFQAAVALVRASGASNAGILVDAMHWFCSGGTVDELSGAESDLITYAQLCDAKDMSFYDGYFHDARNERLIPGDGILPLTAFLAALPNGCPVGLEVPLMAQAKAGVGHEARLAACLSAARTL